MVSSGVDMKAVSDFLAALKKETHGALFTRVKKQSAAEAVSLALQGFGASQDPYGAPWEPLRLRKGRPLLDTGRLRASIATELTAEGFRIGSNVLYAKLQQFGGTILPKTKKALRFAVGRGRKKQWFTRTKVVVPARPFLPREGEPPARWTDAFERVLAKTLASLLGSR